MEKKQELAARGTGAVPDNSGGGLKLTQAARGFWPERWWSLVDFRIGIIPLPVYVLLIFITVMLVITDEVRSDAPTMIAVLVLGGFTCAEIGARLPLLRNIGAAAIFATFIPSALVYYHLIPPKIESAIADFTKSTNFLYIFIASIIVGSILSMDRDVLIKGFLKIFVPLVGRLRGRSDRRHLDRHSPRPRHAPHVLLRRGPDHGGRGWRRQHSAIDRLCRHHRRSAGRNIRGNPAAGDARQPDRHPACRHAQSARQEIS